MNLGIILLVLGIIFIAELPDKSMFAVLVLSTKFRKRYVWLGASTAFIVHVIIAVSAGQLLTLLPHRIVEIIVALLFALGAGLLLLSTSEEENKEDKKLERTKSSQSFWKAFSTSFVVVFIGEWGDITQIVTANYAAKYHDPLSVGIGAGLGLVAVAGFGIVVGGKIIEKIPGKIVQRIIGAILLIFAIVSGISAIKG